MHALRSRTQSRTRITELNCLQLHSNFIDTVLTYLSTSPARTIAFFINTNITSVMSATHSSSIHNTINLLSTSHQETSSSSLSSSSASRTSQSNSPIRTLPIDFSLAKNSLLQLTDSS